MDLKSFRITLQEALQNNATGMGSASRIVMVLGALTLCVCLVLSLSSQAFLGKDMTEIIKAFIYAISASCSGAYTVKQTAIALKGKLTPAEPTKETP